VTLATYARISKAAVFTEDLALPLSVTKFSRQYRCGLVAEAQDSDWETTFTRDGRVWHGKVSMKFERLLVYVGLSEVTVCQGWFVEFFNQCQSSERTMVPPRLSPPGHTSSSSGCRRDGRGTPGVPHRCLAGRMNEGTEHHGEPNCGARLVTRRGPEGKRKFYGGHKLREAAPASNTSRGAIGGDHQPHLSLAAC
jgi:hypothetical protein